jgi:hypothetical protein
MMMISRYRYDRILSTILWKNLLWDVLLWEVLLWVLLLWRTLLELGVFGWRIETPSRITGAVGIGGYVKGVP